MQNRFSRWRPYLISNQNYFSYFRYEMILASEFQSQNFGLSDQEKFNIGFQDGCCGSHLVFKMAAVPAILFSRWRLWQPS